MVLFVVFFALRALSNFRKQVGLYTALPTARRTFLKAGILSNSRARVEQQILQIAEIDSVIPPAVYNIARNTPEYASVFWRKYFARYICIYIFFCTPRTTSRDSRRENNK